jgi:hypothetical protein
MADAGCRSQSPISRQHAGIAAVIRNNQVQVAEAGTGSLSRLCVEQ